MTNEEYHNARCGLPDKKKNEPLACPVERLISKTFCCRDCAAKATYENIAAHKIDYQWNKEGTEVIGSTIKAICRQCFYKMAC